MRSLAQMSPNGWYSDMTNEPTPGNLHSLYSSLREEAERLAGAPEDMRQRARFHLSIWYDSGRNFAFPLLAAHGALWGERHIKRGLRASNVLSLFLDCRDTKRRLVSAFTHELQAINRQVFIETYVNYHITREVGHAASELIGSEVTALLCMCHDARRTGRMLSSEELRALYAEFLNYEQDDVVAPRVSAAVARFEWPLLRFLALKSPVRFSFFKGCEVLWFRALDEKSQRIKNGLRAFDIAERHGWHVVEESLEAYPDASARRTCRLCTCLCPSSA